MQNVPNAPAPVNTPRRGLGKLPSCAASSIVDKKKTTKNQWFMQSGKDERANLKCRFLAVGNCKMGKDCPWKHGEVTLTADEVQLETGRDTLEMFFTQPNPYWHQDFENCPDAMLQNWQDVTPEQMQEFREWESRQPKPMGAKPPARVPYQQEDFSHEALTKRSQEKEDAGAYSFDEAGCAPGDE
eukprot:8191925-Heterocapsa_arctica.AAC.1